MSKAYNIFLAGKLIGTTSFDKADAPMGVVFGKIVFNEIKMPYDFLRAYCQENEIEFEDYPDDKLIATQTIPNLTISDAGGREIFGVANQISGMDSDMFELTILGIPYPLFREEFPHHVRAYEERFK